MNGELIRDVRPIASRGPEASRSFIARGLRLLDVDPDLGAKLDPGERAEVAEHVVLPSVVLERGKWSPEDLGQVSGVHGRVAGFLLVSGAVTADLSIAAHVCTRLLTPGEIVLLDGWEQDSIAAQSGWTVLEPAVLALLDDRLTVIARRWPELMTEILKRAAQQLRHALMQQAIGQLPRVEDRLLALMWSIADRRGVVRQDGVWLRLPVTHAILAQMIGARRPTVSLGLRSLADRGLMRAVDDGWVLAPDSKEIFAPSAASVTGGS